MYNAALVNVPYTFGNLKEEGANDALFKLALLIQLLNMVKEVATLGQLCHNISHIIEGKLIDEADDIGTCFAKSHGIGFRNSMHLSEHLVLF